MTALFSCHDAIVSDDIVKILPFIPDENLQNAHFFITGGTGFVGIWLLNTLLMLSDARKLNLELTVLSRRPEVFRNLEPYLASRVIMWQGDVMDFRYPAGEYQYVIHAATETNAQLNEKAPLLLWDTIVAGTKRVCEFACRCGCRKLLYVSSGAIYGSQPFDMEFLSEEYTGGPDITHPSGATMYAEGKRAGELLSCLYAAQHFGEVKLARLFAFVGPYLPIDEHFAIGNFIGNAIREEPILIRGDGTSVRSYMYAADMALWLLTILFNGRSNRAYNVGSSRSLSIVELAHLIAEDTASSVDFLVNEKVVSGKNVTRYVPSIERAEKELGLKMHWDLLQAIRRTMEWHKARVRLEF